MENDITSYGAAAKTISIKYICPYYDKLTSDNFYPVLTGLCSQYTKNYPKGTSLTSYVRELTLSYDSSTGVLTYQAPLWIYLAVDGDAAWYAHTAPYMDVYIVY